MIKVNRPIKHFIVHCAYTTINMDIDAAEVDRWHKHNGWSGIGYHYFVKRDGTREDGRSLEFYAAAVLGRNHDSINICYAGGKGLDGAEDNIDPVQIFTILDTFREAQMYYPGIKISGHNQHNEKPCPSFDMRVYARKHGINEEDIYQKDPLVSLT